MLFHSPNNEPKVDSPNNKTKNQSPSFPIHQTTKLKTTIINLAIKQNKKGTKVFLNNKFYTKNLLDSKWKVHCERNI